MPPRPTDVVWEAPAEKIRALKAKRAEVERLRRERYRRRWVTPGEFACWMDPTTRQTPALEVLDVELAAVERGEVDKLAIYMPPQEGKALALDTPIATPTGWTTMGGLRVGDQVFDRRGEPCRVTWVSPIWRDRDCYVVRTGDGEAIVADAVHEWPARLDRRGSERLRTSETLARHRNKNARIIGPAALNLPEADLPLDPYVLGAWLGDGTCASPRMTLHPDDVEIRDRFADAGWPLRKAADRYGWTMVPEDWTSSKPSPARQALLAAGVLGDKRLPDAYLRASEKQRLALLQGLIDTDGYVMPKGQVEFCSTSRRLAEGVHELVYSLGAKAVMGVGRATIDGRDCGLKYRVRFYLRDAAWLTRKAERCKDSSVARVRYVHAEPTASVPTRCIEVDSPDHTFLAGRTLLPTHNSERAVRRFVAWLLSIDPSLRIAIVSFEQEMATRWGRQIKRDIEDRPELQIRLRADSQAAGRWETDLGGGVYCVGIKGALTGRPVDVLIIDDPVKDRAAAESKVEREHAWDFWENVAKIRARKTVLIQTRWHTDDLGGRLEQREPGEWRVVKIPAIAEDANDPLGRAVGEEMTSQTPDLRPPGWFARMKASLSAYVWSALFDQAPTASEGNIFKRGDWRFWQAGAEGFVGLDGQLRRLDDCQRFLTIDLATSTKTSADFTVATAWAITVGGELLVLDRRRERVPETDHAAFVAPLRQRWLGRYDVTYIESRMFGTTLVYALGRSGVPIAELEADADKLTRALPYAGMVRQNRVWLPRDAPWLDEWLDEHADFPNTAHDDQVDTGAYAARVAHAHWLPQESAEQAYARDAAIADAPFDPMTVAY